jgi:hypothetical protein
MSRRNYVSLEWLHDYTLGILVHINPANARKGFSLGAMTPLVYFRFLARGILKLTRPTETRRGLFTGSAPRIYPCFIEINSI